MWGIWKLYTVFTHFFCRCKAILKYIIYSKKKPAKCLMKIRVWVPEGQERFFFLCKSVWTKPGLMLKGCLGRRIMLSSFNWLRLQLRHCQVLKKVSLTWDTWAFDVIVGPRGVGGMDPLMLYGASMSVSFDWGTISHMLVMVLTPKKTSQNQFFLPHSFSRYFTFCLVVLKDKGLQ